MFIKFKFDETSEAGQYFMRCTQIRQISLTGLFTKLHEVISKDQMVLSILDDDSKPILDRGKHRKLKALVSKEIGKPTPKQGTASLSDT